MSSKKLSAALLYFMLLPALAQSSTDKVLRDFLATLRDLRTLQGSFVLSATSFPGQRGRVSKGAFYLMRPKYVRWECSYPKFDESIFVGNGETIWFSNVALQQVTIFPMKTVADYGPLGILLMDGKTSDAKFQYESRSDDLDWIAVKTSFSAGDGLESIRIGLRNGAIDTIAATDTTGGKHLMRLTDVVFNKPMPDNLFAFVVPPGFDVVKK